MLIFVWIIGTFLVAWAANARGRSVVGFFVLSMLLSPLIGVLILMAIGSNTTVLDRDALESGHKRKCPSCAELILREAKKCRYCGEQLPDEAPAETVVTPAADTAPERNEASFYVNLILVLLGLAVIAMIADGARHSFRQDASLSGSVDH